MLLTIVGISIALFVLRLMYKVGYKNGQSDLMPTVKQELYQRLNEICVLIAENAKLTNTVCPYLTRMKRDIVEQLTSSKFDEETTVKTIQANSEQKKTNKTVVFKDVKFDRYLNN